MLDNGTVRCWGDGDYRHAQRIPTASAVCFISGADGQPHVAVHPVAI